MRRSLALSCTTLPLLFSIGACKPPLVINNPPQIQVQTPGVEDEINEDAVTGGQVINFRIRLLDLDGDAPLSIQVYLDGKQDSDLIFEADEVNPGDYDPSAGIDTDVPVDTDTDDTDVPEAPDDLDFLDDPEGSFYVTFTHTIPTAGEHSLTVISDDGRTDGETTRDFSFAINGRPSFPGITYAPDCTGATGPCPSTQDPLVAELTENSVDPEGGEVVYQWWWTSDEGAEILDNTFPAVVDARLTQPGQTWTFRILAGEGLNGKFLTDGIRVEVTDSFVIGNRAPGAPTSVRIRPTSPNPAQDLVCVAEGAQDPDNDSVTYKYAWEVFDAGSYVLEPLATTDRLSASFTEAGDQWRCTATSTDGVSDGDSDSDQAVVSSDDISAGAAPVTFVGQAEFEAAGDYVTAININGAGPNELVVGNPTSSIYSNFNPDGGLVRVFRRDSSSWVDRGTSTTNWTISGYPDGYVGAPVVTIPDVDGDGSHEVIICAPGVNGEDAAAFIVSGGSLNNSDTQIDPLSTGFDGITFDGFGNAYDGSTMDVAATDLDGDNRAELFMAFANIGKILIYPSSAMFSGNTLTPSFANATITNGSSTDRFGYSVDASGDFNGDLIGDLLVGAPDDAGGVGVYLFDGATISGHAMTESNAIISISDAASNDLGTMVAFVPDLNNDGFDEIAAGLPGASGGVGAVAIFFGQATPSGSWTVGGNADILIEGTESGGAFGDRFVVLGDTGTDGLPELAIGAPGASGGAGHVYLFASEDYASASSLSATDRILEVSGNNPGDSLNVTRVNLDIDEDGIPDLVLGAPGALTTVADAGEVYLFLTNQ